MCFGYLDIPPAVGGAPHLVIARCCSSQWPADTENRASMREWAIARAESVLRLRPPRADRVSSRGCLGPVLAPGGRWRCTRSIPR